MLACVNVWVLSVRNRLLLAVSAFVERVNQIPADYLWKKLMFLKIVYFDLSFHLS